MRVSRVCVWLRHKGRERAARLTSHLVLDLVSLSVIGPKRRRRRHRLLYNRRNRVDTRRRKGHIPAWALCVIRMMIDGALQAVSFQLGRVSYLIGTFAVVSKCHFVHFIRVVLN